MSFPKSHSFRLISAVLLALSLIAPATYSAQTSAAPHPAQLDATRYLNDIKALTTPQMEGRGDGTKGLALAEHLIERRYKALGLEPAGSNGYQQPFTVITGARIKGANHLRVQTADKKFDLKLNEEYVPFSFSSSSAATGGLVFAGYGATAPEFGYDDYAGVDVKEKIVVVLRYEPASFEEKSGHAGATQHAHLITKAINARNHGAKAVVLVNGQLQPKEEDLLTRFGSVSGPTDAGILLVQAKNAEVEKWFAAAGKSMAELQGQINHMGKPVSFAFPESVHASVDVRIENTQATVSNVLAYLPGLTDEYVIVGAHYDHLGRGNFDSLAPDQIGQIHPGADDNASGTAGVLE
ncbi:MAG TPA: M28 family peptidase, partial [Terriglobales bacterium]|nr:M28 family peptidase [Terriglobales bacterium]